MIISAPLAVAARAEPIDDANKREYSKLALICNHSRFYFDIVLKESKLRVMENVNSTYE